MGGGISTLYFLCPMRYTARRIVHINIMYGAIQ